MIKQNEKDCGVTKFDRLIEELAGQLRQLGCQRQAAFFAACGEALLPLYEHFNRETGWGDVAVLRKALEAAWQYATSNQKTTANELLKAIEAATPHTDDFETPASLYAQDAAICTDCALKASSEDNPADPACIEYALEPMKAALSLEHRGVVDVGSAKEDVNWLDQIASQPRMSQAIEACRRMIMHLESVSQLQPSDISVLQAIAAALRP